MNRMTLRSVRPNTYRAYKTMVDTHIIPELGPLSLGELTTTHVQQFYAKLAKKHPRAAQVAHARLSQALCLAEDQGKIMRNPCAKARVPHVAARRIAPLDTEQARAFLRAASNDRLYVLYLLAVTVGLRQGELFALRWTDIDFENGAISIIGTLVEDHDGRLVVGEPKTKSSRRKVEVDPFVMAALQRHRQKSGETDYVFTDTKGKPLRKSNVIRRSFHPLLTAAKLPRIRFHDLRHSSATIMFALGVPAKVVQERLGHAKIGMTLDTYSHLVPGMQRDAANAVGRALFGD